MKAVALISGGLDSTLAAKIVADFGVPVVGVHFSHPFCAGEKKALQALRGLAAALARDASVELRDVRLGREFLDIVKPQTYRCGSRIKPCIECRMLMFKKAREMMASEGAAFLVTGEIARGMLLRQGEAVDRAAGVEGLVLRPLSARLMKETVPEKEGWIDRSKLYAFSGRARRPLIDLAVMRGVIDFPQAPEGCLLTDPCFSRRVEDLLRHDRLSMEEVELLKLGRHFRLSAQAKLVVGRNAAENAALEASAEPEDVVLFPSGDIPGPTALCRGEADQEHLRLAASIVGRYCDRAGRESFEICLRGRQGKDPKSISVAPAVDAQVQKYRI